MAGVGRDWQIEFRPFHAWIFREPAAALGYPNFGEGWLDRLERRSTKIEATVVDGRAFKSCRRGRGSERSSFTGAATFPARRTPRSTRQSLWQPPVRHAPAKLAERMPPLRPQRLTRDDVPPTCRRRTQACRAGIREHPHRPTFGADRFPIVSSRRHLRKTDSFVHVDPKSLGIEE
jgi:hypothetical protein